MIHLSRTFDHGAGNYSLPVRLPAGARSAGQWTIILIGTGTEHEVTTLDKQWDDARQGTIQWCLSFLKRHESKDRGSLQAICRPKILAVKLEQEERSN
jgi:hypothetical protein